MKKKLTLLIGVVLVLFVSGIVYAADKDATEETTEVTEETEKEMTYGQCVSENAAIKNTCYATAKDSLATCKAQAEQDTTTKKDATKQCKQTYKKDKKQCKTDFKSSKNECKKIKHNFLETVGSSMK